MNSGDNYCFSPVLPCSFSFCLILLCFSAKGQARQTAAPAALLQGIWAASPEENAEFWIEGTRLTYVEFLDEHLRYSLTSTTFTIFLKDGPYRCRLKKLTKDSLVYVTPYGFVVRLYKRK